MNKYKPIKISKEEISKLETDAFSGRIIVVQNEQDIEKAVSYLSDFPILGVDTETRPSFRKGKSHTVALIQIATEDTCFLFRINRTGFTPTLKTLFEDPNITKIGLSLKDDFSMLHKIAPFEPKGFIELQSYVKQFNIEDMQFFSERKYPNLKDYPIGKPIYFLMLKKDMQQPTHGLVSVYIKVFRQSVFLIFIKNPHTN